MRLIKLFSLAAGLAGAVAACNSRDERAPDFAEADDDGGPPPVQPLAFDDFIEQAEAAYCGWAVRCGGHLDEASCRANEAFEVRFGVDNLASGYYAELGDTPTEYLKRAIEERRIDFDGEAAASCIAYVEARDCYIPGTYVMDEVEQARRDACWRVFTGSVGRNGPCLSGAECAPESPICGTDPNNFEECAPGGCRAFAAIGARCGSDASCGPDNYCGFDFNASPPQQVCMKGQPVGGSCGNGERCVGGTFCNYQTYLCSAQSDEGEGCSAYEDSCTAGLYCRDDQDDAFGVCVPFSDRGEPCDYFGHCKRIDDFCDATGTCRAVSQAAAASCFDRPCQAWEYCNYPTERCEPRAGLGEPCGEEFVNDEYKSVQCFEGVQCSGFELATSVCEAPLAGSTCPVPSFQPASEPPPGQG